MNGPTRFGMVGGTRPPKITGTQSSQSSASPLESTAKNIRQNTAKLSDFNDPFVQQLAIGSQSKPPSRFKRVKNAVLGSIRLKRSSTLDTGSVSSPLVSGPANAKFKQAVKTVQVANTVAKPSKKNPNKKTIKELGEQFSGHTETYSKTLTDDIHSSTQLNGTTNVDDVEKVDRGHTRSTADCIVDCHKLNSETNGINGSGTVHAMMVNEVMEGSYSTKVEAEFNEATKIINECLSPTDSTKVYKEIGDHMESFSSPSTTHTEYRTKLYEKTVSIARGLSMVKALADNSDGDPVFICRTGFVNPEKTGIKEGKDKIVDKAENDMLKSEQAFAKLMGNLSKVGGKTIHYAYNNINIQSDKLKSEATNTAIDTDTMNQMAEILNNAKQHHDHTQESPDTDVANEYTHTGMRALKTLRNPKATTLDRVIAQEVFGRALDKLTNGDCQRINHCKSGKDRTGSMAWTTHLNDKMLSDLNIQARSELSTHPDVEFNETLKTLATCIDPFEAQALIQAMPTSDIKTSLQTTVTANDDAKFKALNFNAEEHCGRVMAEDPEKKSKSKLSELDTTVMKYVTGGRLLNKRLAGGRGALAFATLKRAVAEINPVNKFRRPKR
eukprot:COSAG01_NODE_2485_length_7594_cov_36.632021_8_plen_611_part_00